MPRAALQAMVLVGAWDPSRDSTLNEEDDGEILQILGSDRDTVAALCEVGQKAGVIRYDSRRRFRMGESGKSWRWVDPRAAWRRLAPIVDDAGWDCFEKACLAVLSGQGSSILRRGLVFSLGLFGNSDDQIDADPPPSIRAARIVEQTLTAEMHRWQDLHEHIEMLAEASPEAFLQSIERSLQLSRSSGASVGPETTRQAIGRALALLALDVDLLPQVTLVLAQLAKADEPPKANWHDAHPLHVLEEVFDPQWPKTNATVEERLAALELLRAKDPEVARVLFLQLIEGRGTRVLSVPRPRILRLSVPALRRGISGAAVYGQLETFLAWLIDLAGTDGDRWAEIVSKAKRLPTNLLLTTLQRIKTIQSHLHDDKQLLWNSLRTLLSVRVLNSYGGEDTDSEESAKERHANSESQARAQDLYKQLTPHDFVDAHAWLFGENPQFPGRYSTVDEHYNILTQAQRRCIDELAEHSDRRKLLGRLAARVNDVPLLARLLAQNSWAEELEQQISWMQGLRQHLAVWFLAYRIANRSFAEIELWVRHFATAGQSSDAALLAQLMTGGSSQRDAQLWDLLDALGGSIHQEYWLKIGVHRISDPQPKASTERVIRNFLEVARWDGAKTAAIVLKEPASTAQRLEVLKCWREAMIKEGGRHFSYAVAWVELWDRLDPKNPEEIAQARREETAWLPALGDTHYKARWLPEWLAKEPAAFVEISRTPNAKELLMLWQGWPGDTLPAEVAQDRLYVWAQAVLAQLNDAAPQRSSLRILASVLARPKGIDGLWPSDAVRRLLKEEHERGGSTLFSALKESRRDQHSGHARPVDSWVNEAQELAADCESSAQQLTLRWPVAARLCHTLAESYKQTAADWQERNNMWDERDEMQQEQVAQGPLFPLTELRITNFRGIEQATMSELHPRLNILYGRNASGKTTILDALAIGLAGLAARLPSEIQEKDPKLPSLQEKARHRKAGSREPARQIRIVLSGQPYRGEALSWQVERNYARGAESQDGESAGLSPYLDTLNEGLRTKGARTLLPVFAYYGVERALSERAKEPETPSGRERTRADGLIGALWGAADFEQATEWFRREQFLQMQEREEKPNHERPALREVLQAVAASVVTPEGVGVKNLRIGKRTLKLEVTFARPGQIDERLELDELSDGFRTHLALVMDLARRMAECNPLPEGEREQADFGRNSRAVVLIDEVDAHLHPSWQKTVLRGLLDAFPQAQFFVTTHSPLVLGSQRDAKVWLLEDGDVSVVGQLYGKTSDVILRDYQDTTPYRDELQKKIELARTFIKDRKFNEAAALIAQLESETDSDLSDLVALRTRLELARNSSANAPQATEKSRV